MEQRWATPWRRRRSRAAPTLWLTACLLGCTHHVNQADKTCTDAAGCVELVHVSCLNPVCHCGGAVDAVAVDEAERYQRAERWAHCPVSTPTMCECAPDPLMAVCENGICVLQERSAQTP